MPKFQLCRSTFSFKRKVFIQGEVIETDLPLDEMFKTNPPIFVRVDGVTTETVAEVTASPSLLSAIPTPSVKAEEPVAVVIPPLEGNPGPAPEKSPITGLEGEGGVKPPEGVSKSLQGEETPEKPALVESSKDLRGRLVTETFKIAVDEDFLVFRKAGRYHIYDVDNPMTDLTPDGVKRAEVELFIRQKVSGK